MQTPTRPVAAAYPWAAWPAPCSWRTRMCRILESNSGSYAGRIAPPGMPKMFSAPGRLQRADQALRAGDLLALCSLMLLHPVWSVGRSAGRPGPTKNPSAGWQRGVTRVRGLVGSAHASRAYEKVRAHAPTVAAGAVRASTPVCQPSQIWYGGPTSWRPRLVGRGPRQVQMHDLVAVGVREHPRTPGPASSLTRVPPASSAASIRPRPRRAARRRRGGSAAGLALRVGLLEPERAAARRRGRRLVVAACAVAEHRPPERLDRRVVRACRARARATVTAAGRRRSRLGCDSLIRRARSTSRLVTPRRRGWSAGRRGAGRQVDVRMVVGLLGGLGDPRDSARPVSKSPVANAGVQAAATAASRQPRLGTCSGTVPAVSQHPVRRAQKGCGPIGSRSATTASSMTADALIQLTVRTRAEQVPERALPVGAVVGRVQPGLEPAAPPATRGR